MLKVSLICLGGCTHCLRFSATRSCNAHLPKANKHASGLRRRPSMESGPTDAHQAWITRSLHTRLSQGLDRPNMLI